MAHKMQHWMEAATVIFAARCKGSSSSATSCKPLEQNFKVLHLKRHSKSKAFPNSYVYPGGKVDDSDFSLRWLDVFKTVGISSLSDLGWISMKSKPRPDLLAKERGDNFLPNDVAFRINAIRETFEESGILLLSPTREIRELLSNTKSSSLKRNSGEIYSKPKCYNGVNHVYLKEWQKKVYEDPEQFLHMCKALDAVPNIWGLIEWDQLLTPAFFKRRFDTVFYFCALEDIPEVTIDDSEIVHKEWLYPSEVLQQFYAGEVSLDPPQIMQSLRMLNFQNVEDLEQFGLDRSDQGLDMMMPKIFFAEDGMLGVLPGDDLYPADIDCMKPDEMTQLNETIEDNMKRCKNLFRNVFIGEKREHSFVCNIQLPNGRISPKISLGGKIGNMDFSKL